MEAALAHHNLGSYEESLKYLETAKVQLYESERDKVLQKKRMERKKLLAASTEKSENSDSTANLKIEVLDSEISLPYDVNFYIFACKGNVYQSCGDDEQSLLQYLSAWESALSGQYHDWEMLFINSIGLLAYYNLHFELALRCFHKVSRYRERVSPSSFLLTISLTRTRSMGLAVLILRLPGIIKGVVSIVSLEEAWRESCLRGQGMFSMNVWAHGILGRLFPQKIAKR